MKEPYVETTAEGDLALRDLPPALAYALRQLPLLLSDDAPGVRCRVTASPYPDDEESREWLRHATPELEHLFVSARELVLADLEGLAREGVLRPAYRIEIPGEHVNAWLSALGAARVGLGTAYEVESEDMSHPLPGPGATERDRAILLIHLLGWLQGMIVQGGEEE